MRHGAATVLLVACFAVAACSADATSTATSAMPSTMTSTVDTSAPTTVAGVLAPPDSAHSAYTYDTAAAPAGAELSVAVTGSGEGTEVELTATGLVADRGYAAHAHTEPCGATGDSAGPHFQNEQDPAATPDRPSVDPAYANPENEIWLHLHTGSDGSGTTRAAVPFRLGDRAPASIVLHEKPATATAPGEAGKAGGRVACVTLAEPHHVARDLVTPLGTP
jgi:superoxide dismutase, Cu-Zn family